MKYKLTEKCSKPGVKNATETKFYATPQTERALPAAQFAKGASVGMAITPKEMEAAIDQFGQYALQQLIQGRSVDVPGIGSLRVTFKSAGVDEPELFRAQSMITKPRIVFTPKADVKSQLEQGLSYEIAGVRAGKEDYVSIKAYRKAMGGGTAGDDEPDTPSGGGGGGTTTGGDEPGEDRP